MELFDSKNKKSLIFPEIEPCTSAEARKIKNLPQEKFLKLQQTETLIKFLLFRIEL